MAGDSEVPRTLGGNPLIEQARRDFDRCAEYEAHWRQLYRDDIRFANADSDNNFQWPNALRRTRDVANKPCLTLNVTNQHNLILANGMRQNKSEVKVVGTGNGSTAESASVMRSLIRHIMYQSSAQSAFTLARQFMIEGGLGWWRIITDYEHPETFDQEIYILPVPDPLSVYIDPDCKQPDKSDARFGFVFDMIKRKEFEKTYKRLVSDLGTQPLGVGSTLDDPWMNEDHVRIAEYFYTKYEKDKLLSFLTPQGARLEIRKKRLPDEVYEELLARPTTYVRDTELKTIKWCLIVGMKVVDETDWLGSYIPLIPALGVETNIDGMLDRKGHTRAMKSAQRMYNYNASGQVEFVALQSKTPYIAAAKAIEGYETYWATANTDNHAVLPFNHVDEENPDRDVPPPQRQEPPNFSPGFQSGMDTAFTQMMMTSGQWQNQMGMAGNERTGEAIAERQEQSDKATFHFDDNYASALRYTGRQLIDLVPKIYNTRRIKRVLDDNGQEMELVLDPGAKASYVQEQNHMGNVISRIFNPGLGRYDIAAEVGPAISTRRQETVKALTLILTQAPALTGIIGDMLVRALDFDEAQEAALRLRRMVPPQALGSGPTQQEQQQQQVIQQLQQALSKALESHAKDRLKLAGKDQMRDIDAYKAQTDRFKALSDALMLDQGGLESVIHQLVGESLQTHLTPIVRANASDLGDQGGDQPPLEPPPMPGAKQAPDGEWYILDPTRRGKYLRVAPLAQMRTARGVQANA